MRISALILACLSCTSSLAEEKLKTLDKSPAPFYDGVSPVSIEGRWIILNADGTTIATLPPTITNIRPFIGSVAPFEQRDKWGLLDTAGHILLAPRFGMLDHSSASHGLYAVHEFADNMPKGSWGFINIHGAFIIDCKYSAVGRFSQGLCPVQKDDKWTFVNANGDSPFASTFDRATPFAEGLAVVRKGDRYGAINQLGDYVIAPSFLDMRPFNEGMAAARNLSKTPDNGLWGFVDCGGRWVIKPQFLVADTFSLGRALVDRQDGTSAYIDKTGAVVSTCDAGRPYTMGRAAITTGNKWYYIDLNGRLCDNDQFDEAGQFVGGRAWVRRGPDVILIDLRGKSRLSLRAGY